MADYSAAVSSDRPSPLAPRSCAASGAADCAWAAAGAAASMAVRPRYVRREGVGSVKVCLLIPSILTLKMGQLREDAYFCERRATTRPARPRKVPNGSSYSENFRLVNRMYVVPMIDPPIAP